MPISFGAIMTEMGMISLKQKNGQSVHHTADLAKGKI